KRVLAGMASVDRNLYNLRAMHQAVQHDVHVLTEIWQRVKEIKPAHDSKLQQIRALLANELKGKKVLIFTYYKDTARYLYKHLGDPSNPDAVTFQGRAGGVKVRRMDSGNHPDERMGIVQAFAPKANGMPELAGSDKEIDILISTDVLSEGQNL